MARKKLREKQSRTEYFRKYRKQNPQKIKDINKKHYERMKELMELGKKFKQMNP